MVEKAFLISSKGRCIKAARSDSFSDAGASAQISGCPRSRGFEKASKADSFSDVLVLVSTHASARRY